MADKATESLVFRLKASTISSNNIELDEDHTLGQGSYGRVFPGVYRGKTVAVKSLHKIFFQLGDIAHQKSVIRSLLVECELLSRLQHPHIVQLFGVVYPGTANMLMVTELMDISLDKRYGSSPALTLCDEVDIAHDVICALAYLHGYSPQSIMHRDLAPKNILLTEDAANGLVAKLADVGLAKVLQSSQIGRVEGTVCPGTQSYMPPEALVARSAVYGTSLDIFSFGVTVIEVVLRKTPTVLERQRRADLEEVRQRKHMLYVIVADCVKDDADARPTAEKLQGRLQKIRLSKRYVRASNQRIAARKRSKAVQADNWRDEYFKLLEEEDIEMVELNRENEELKRQDPRKERTELLREQTQVRMLQMDLEHQMSQESSASGSERILPSSYAVKTEGNLPSTPSPRELFSAKEYATRDIPHTNLTSTKPRPTSHDIALPALRTDSTNVRTTTYNLEGVSTLARLDSTLRRPTTYNSYGVLPVPHTDSTIAWPNSPKVDSTIAWPNSPEVDSTIVWPSTCSASNGALPHVDSGSTRPTYNSHNILAASHVDLTTPSPSSYTSQDPSHSPRVNMAVTKLEYAFPKDVQPASRLESTTTGPTYYSNADVHHAPHVDSATTRPTFTPRNIMSGQRMDSTTTRLSYSLYEEAQPSHHNVAVLEAAPYGSFRSQTGRDVIAAGAQRNHSQDRLFRHATFGREPMRSILTPKPLWQKLPELPVQAVQESCSTFWKGVLYVAVPCRGRSMLKVDNELVLLRLKADPFSWEKVPVQSPSRVAWPSALHVDVKRNYLYVTIVDDQFAKGEPDTLWILNESSGRWEYVRSLEFARRATALHGDLFIAAGGCSSMGQRFTESKHQVDVINLQTNTEMKWCSMPSGYYEGRLIAFGEELLCLGGHENSCISAIDTRHPVTWRTHDSSPLPAYLCGITSYATSLYCVGGLTSSSHPPPKAISTVRQWTIRSGWQELPSMAEPRIVPSMAVHDGSLYCVGGQSADLMLSMNSVHRLTLESWA